jgi:hypothetical protein
MPPNNDNPTRTIVLSDEDRHDELLAPAKAWFLGIGINTYKDFTNLNNAVRDVLKVKDTLLKKYDLEEAQATLLLEEEATEVNIIKQLDTYADTLTVDDKLLIYYSGHGHLNRHKKGFWIPQDARQSITSSYIRNSTIREYLEVIDARHILLVSDSCFSGSLFVRGTHRNIIDEEAEAEAFEQLASRSSRWGICSGRADREVQDGAAGGHSPFAESFINVLKRNRNRFINVAKIANDVYFQIKTNYEQEPLGKPLFGLGDQGGQYIFRLKDNEEERWKAAAEQNTIESFEKYKELYPQGQFIAKADFAIAELKAELDQPDDQFTLGHLDQAFQNKLATQIKGRVLENGFDVGDLNISLQIIQKLSGTVKSLEDKEAIEAFLKNINGTAAIENNLVIGAEEEPIDTAEPELTAHGVPIRRAIGSLTKDHPDVVSFAKALKLMRELPEDNPMSLAYQVKLFAKYSIHGSWYKLPWLRAQLYYFEKICRKLLNEADFALPYWDVVKLRKVPGVFFQMEELKDTTRRVNQKSRPSNNYISIAEQDKLLSTDDFGIFGGTSARSGALESGLHNYIHGWVGGNMGYVDASPKDPLFWVHHANIDRIWALWNQLGNKNPNDPTWREYTFDKHFYDADEEAFVSVKVSDFAAIHDLGYTYPGLETEPSS